MSPFRSNSTAAAQSVEITVFTSPISRPIPLRIVFCEILVIFREPSYPPWQELQPPIERHFLRRRLQWPTFRPESRLAFALWTRASQVLGASIEWARLEPAAMYEPQ